jgi:hypothetical protein
VQTNFRRRQIDPFSRSFIRSCNDSCFAKKVVGCQTNLIEWRTARILAPCSAIKQNLVQATAMVKGT